MTILIVSGIFLLAMVGWIVLRKNESNYTNDAIGTDYRASKYKW